MERQPSRRTRGRGHGDGRNGEAGLAPSEAIYTDAASGVENTAVNSIYAVRGLTAGGEVAAPSNRVSEFDFGLPVAGPLPVVDHCGTISTNQIWGPSAAHRLTCSVTVAAGVKLKVLAGTVVKFQTTAMTVNGTLEASGSAQNLVYFTAPMISCTQSACGSGGVMPSHSK